MKIEVENYEYEKMLEIIHRFMDNCIIEEGEITFPEKADNVVDEICDLVQGSY